MEHDILSDGQRMLTTLLDAGLRATGMSQAATTEGEAHRALVDAVTSADRIDLGYEEDGDTFTGDDGRA